MNKKSLLIAGCLLLLAGWFSAFILNSIPQHSSFYIFGPTLLLGSGMGLLHKSVGWKKTAISLVFTALAALLLMNQLFPERSISVSAFKQRMMDGQRGKPVSLEVREQDRVAAFTVGRSLEAFAEVTVRLFARLPGAPRMLTFDPDGNLYVTIPNLGAVYRLTDRDHDGYADNSTLYHVGMDRPHGLVWAGERLYVAEPSQLLELNDTDSDGQVDQVRVVADGFPDDGGHWARSVVSGTDGFLYLSIGSRCNACEEKNRLRGTVVKIDPASDKVSIFARGLRNTVGLAFSPLDQTLWGTDIGRDGLGAKLPPDEINRIAAGGDYGWPFCYGDKINDPVLGSDAVCRQTLASRVDLPAHSAPMGIAFGHSLHAPAVCRNSLYVVFSGNADSDNPTAGKLIRIPYNNSQMADHGKEFLAGWGIADKAWGHPVAVAVGPDGNLYLSDEKARAIYQISWKQPD